MPAITRACLGAHQRLSPFGLLNEALTHFMAGAQKWMVFGPAGELINLWMAFPEDIAKEREKKKGFQSSEGSTNPRFVDRILLACTVIPGWCSTLGYKVGYATSRWRFLVRHIPFDEHPLCMESQQTGFYLREIFLLSFSYDFSEKAWQGGFGPEGQQCGTTQHPGRTLKPSDQIPEITVRRRKIGIL